MRRKNRKAHLFFVYQTCSIEKYWEENVILWKGENGDMDGSTFLHLYKNKAGYTATEVACGWEGHQTIWAGAVRSKK